MSTSVFDRSNIAETPNPKPLHVERVGQSIRDNNGFVTGQETLIIRNVNLDPAAHTVRW